MTFARLARVAIVDLRRSGADVGRLVGARHGQIGEYAAESVGTAAHERLTVAEVAAEGDDRG